MLGCTGDCQPALLKCGLLPALPPRRWSWCVGGSKTGGGQYIEGYEVNDSRGWVLGNEG